MRLTFAAEVISGLWSLVEVHSFYVHSYSFVNCLGAQDICRVKDQIAKVNKEYTDHVTSLRVLASQNKTKYQLSTLITKKERNSFGIRLKVR
jgi:hypothetical protein